MNKHLVWAITIFSIMAMLCGTLIWINYNSWTLRFEMDNNTKEAIQSIDWEILNEPIPSNADYYKLDFRINTSKQYFTLCGRNDSFVNGENLRMVFNSKEELLIFQECFNELLENDRFSEDQE